MNLEAIIAQLRATAPIFAGRVAGAADFATGLESTVWMDLPAAYVVPLGEEAEGNTDLNGLFQAVHERIGIIGQFSNLQDRRGQTVTDLYSPARAQIFRAILNWNPEPERAARGLSYSGGRLLEFDRARLFYQWEFTLGTVFTDADGWQPDSLPLQSIIGNITAGDGAIIEKFGVTLPQS